MIVPSGSMAVGVIGQATPTSTASPTAVPSATPTPPLILPAVIINNSSGFNNGIDFEDLFSTLNGESWSQFDCNVAKTSFGLLSGQSWTTGGLFLFGVADGSGSTTMGCDSITATGTGSIPNSCYSNAKFETKGAMVTLAGISITEKAVASLPTCTAALDGTVYIVNNAVNAAGCTVGTTPAGGGTTYCSVVCHNGVGWVHF